MTGLRFVLLGSIGSLLITAIAVHARAGQVDPGWKLADQRGKGDSALALFVEATPTPGRPTFRLETSFTVPPTIAHRVLIEGMLATDEAPDGQRREVRARTENGAIVYTYIDLPLMLADREVALRIVESRDPATDVHRIEWAEANELLPPVDTDVVRLTGAAGYWEFKPDGQGGTQAIHETRTEIGGSFPAALGDRLMKSQAIEAVETLRARIDRTGRSDVAAGPPE